MNRHQILFERRVLLFLEDVVSVWTNPFSRERRLRQVDDLGQYAQGVKKQLESAPDVIAMQEGMMGM